MKNSGAGCWLGGMYYCGLLGYADDLLILAPSREGAQQLLNIASEYASEHSVSYSTNSNPNKSKTKGIIFEKCPSKKIPVGLDLNGDKLSYVDEAKYLGCTLTARVDGLQCDMSIKRALYTKNFYELKQEFYASPTKLCRINAIYNMAFYGAPLWDLSSEGFTRLCNSHSRIIRNVWDLHYSTHRRFLEKLGGVHAYSRILTL